jgi:hypothetical protein
MQSPLDFTMFLRNAWLFVGGLAASVNRHGTEAYKSASPLIISYEEPDTMYFGAMVAASVANSYRKAHLPNDRAFIVRPTGS